MPNGDAAAPDIQEVLRYLDEAIGEIYIALIADIPLYLVHMHARGERVLGEDLQTRLRLVFDIYHQAERSVARRWLVDANDQLGDRPIIALSEGRTAEVEAAWQGRLP